MILRHGKPADLDAIQAVYQAARKRMALQGNPDQWKQNRPRLEATLDDLARNNLYVVEDQGQIVGVFAFILGEDPTYAIIEQGQWLNEEPYGVIHRIAALQPGLHLFDLALGLAQSKTSNLRIDTHHQNQPMLHLLARHGFMRCGIITTDDGTKRIAFQKLLTTHARSFNHQNSDRFFCADGQL